MIGVRDESTERIAEQLTRQSGLQLEWSIEESGEGIQGLRLDGIEPRHGVLLVLSRTLHRAEAALVAEPYAGHLLRTLGENVSFDPTEWAAVRDEAEDRGIKVSIVVNGELLTDLTVLPNAAWRTLEVECACRVPRGGPPAEAQLRLAAAACLSFLVSGLRSVNDPADDSTDQLPGLEGTARRIVETRYERDPANRLRCIEYYGARCWVCDFEFSESYGDLGAGYIVVHHTLPVSKMGPGYRVDPVAEMVPLCANCHAMVHRVDPPLPPEELRNLLDREPKPFRPSKVVGLARSSVGAPVPARIVEIVGADGGADDT